MPVIAWCGDLGSPLSKSDRIARHVRDKFSNDFSVEVRDFGAAMATAVDSKIQYCKTEVFRIALAAEPLVIVLSLGTNDACGKTPTHELKESFKTGMENLLVQAEREVPDCTVLLLPALGCRGKHWQERLRLVQEAY
eukprot:TRINITY_DN24453_c0_g1_i1.p2 TRINITY_DN24453_c0_g1~~TRINITY_DN24453_c0_g1_i1.p2  ORF type:complete len:137 (+),score=24.12 TRINITY_DN24453_c0_g1_i1:50-460(+)